MLSSYMNDFLPVIELNLFVNFTRKKIRRGLLTKLFLINIVTFSHDML